MKILALLLIVINLASCSSGNTNPDYKNKIIGKWVINKPGIPYYYGQAEYKESGEMVGWGKAVFPDGTIKETKFHDSWEIHGNKITFKPLKKYRNEAMNKVVTDTIIDINDKEMILLNADGKKLVRTRMKSK